MKQLTPPFLDFYTDAELAHELEIDHWKIKRACETGKLAAELVPKKTEVSYGQVNSFTGSRSSRTYSYAAYYKIPLIAAQNFALKLALPSAMPEPATGEINPKEKESLLKLVAVLAATGYGYDPTQKKSPIPAQIQNDADLLGISFDVDTVRKWLKNASVFLPPKEDHSAS